MANEWAKCSLGASADIIGSVRLDPPDYGALGVYSLATGTNTMAAGLAALSEIYHWRWADATRVCAILYFGMWAGNGSPAFAAGTVSFLAAIARSWTANGTGGGQATLGGHNQKLRTSMATAIQSGANVRTATTGALTAGTKTIDAHAFSIKGGSVAATAGTPLVLPSNGVFLDTQGGQMQPIVLAQNEGITVLASVPGTGTWSAGFNIIWAERPA